MTIVGYARVSTNGQTLATQRAMLKAAGVERIYAEKVSGIAAKRPELERVLDELEAGDVLAITKLDRLARSTLDLLRIIDRIAREALRRVAEGEPLREIALSYAVDHSTISRLKARHV
jgi:DNA invertase Pin-like site-specific DNA recombinase